MEFSIVLDRFVEILKEFAFKLGLNIEKKYLFLISQSNSTFLEDIYNNSLKRLKNVNFQILTLKF